MKKLEKMKNWKKIYAATSSTRSQEEKLVENLENLIVTSTRSQNEK